MIDQNWVHIVLDDNFCCFFCRKSNRYIIHFICSLSVSLYWCSLYFMCYYSVFL